MQIFGSLPANEQVNNKETDGKIHGLLVIDERKQKNGLSASPVVVRYREDMKDML